MDVISCFLVRIQRTTHFIMKELLNLLGSFRLFIGILLLSLGCFLDFSCGGAGTAFRFVMGLFGAYLMVGNVREGMGHIVFFILGFVGYAFAIRSGKLSVIDDVVSIEGWFKYILRAICAFIFIFGYRDVKERSL